MTTTTDKNVIISLLRAWIEQRPGLDPRDYISGWNDTRGRAAYRQDQRRTIDQKHDAEILLIAVENSQITGEELAAAFPRAFSGRLELTGDRLTYCTGQYWPTEYRAAACAVLASALWQYHRPDCMGDPKPGDAIRAKFRRMFGRKIQQAWFD